MRRRSWIILVLVIVVLASIATYIMWLPSKDVNTSVSCKDLEKYQSRFGVFNAPHFVLGQVLELNKSNKRGQSIDVIQPEPNEVSEEPDPVGNTSIISNAEFEIKTDVKLPSNDELDMNSRIQNNTLFVLKNSRRKNLSDAATIVDRKPRLKALIQNAPPDRIFLIISSLLLADGLSFKLKDAREATEGGQVLKIGKFNIHVKYECQGSLDVSATQGALFFKATVLKYNSSSHKIEADITEAVDLRDYDFTLALQ